MRVTGFEPATWVLKVPCSTNWATPPNKKPRNHFRLRGSCVDNSYTLRCHINLATFLAFLTFKYQHFHSSFLCPIDIFNSLVPARVTIPIFCVSNRRINHLCYHWVIICSATDTTRTCVLGSSIQCYCLLSYSGIVARIRFELMTLGFSVQRSTYWATQPCKKAFFRIVTKSFDTHDVFLLAVARSYLL